MADFVDTPVPADIRIYGTNGVPTGTLMGTVEWEVEDDQGRMHKIRLPNTIYSSGTRNRLLSPQHWAQGANDRYPIRYGTWCATYDDRIELYWDQRRYKRTVYLLEEGSNVGVLRGVRNVEEEKNYDKLAKAFKNVIVAMPTVLETIRHETDEYEINDHEEKYPERRHEKIQVSDKCQNKSQDNERDTTEEIFTKINYKLENKETDDYSELSKNKDGAKQGYLYWHQKLGHLSHGRMQQLINSGTLPKHLNMKTPPVCVACINGKSTRKPWRTKGSRNDSRKATYPGECVAIDQLESSTAGFIGKMRGAILTNQRYRYTTVFVDLFSDYTYIYMHTAITADETLKAKKAFELHANSFRIKVKQYHADNGRFQDIKFKEHCVEQGQRLTYCGVNAHFQNGQAERKIRDLQDGARTSLLHAMKKWPTAITVNLWPYAMRYINDVNNYVPRKHESQSPIEMFSLVKQGTKLQNFHHFGCPVYVLDHNLQAGRRSGMKWKDRVRLGVNLGFSPQHAK
jgi:hypothetical protein